LGRPEPGATVLDIGCGQGEFALHLQRLYPELAVWGVEYSAEGVTRGRARAAAEGLAVQFRQVDLLQPTVRDADQPPATAAVSSEVLKHVHVLQYLRA